MAKRRAEGLDLDEDVVKKKPKLEENQTCILNLLPEELIQQILIRVPIRYLEQCAIAAVCSEFARLTSDYLFWRSLCIYHWGENLAPLKYTDPSDPNYDTYIIPTQENSNRPDWRKYCIYRYNNMIIVDEDAGLIALYRGHFQLAMQETNLALDKLGMEKAKLNEWADLNKVYIVHAIGTLSMREVGDTIVSHDYFPFFCDVLAIMHADQHFITSIYKVIDALDMRVEKFNPFTHGLALVSFYEKYNRTLSYGYASELLHISSESFKQLVSKNSIISDIERAKYYLKRLLDAWIQFSYSSPEIINEDFTLPRDSLHFPTRIAQALISDQTNESVAENLSQIIVERAWKEYNDNEKDWKRKLVALTIVSGIKFLSSFNGCGSENVPVSLIIRMGLDAFKDSREPVKICGIIFLDHASLQKHLTAAVELPSDVVIETITAFLQGMEILPNHKSKLFVGMSGILLYCSEKPALTDLITEELFARIHSMVLNVVPELVDKPHGSGLLSQLIGALMRFSHAEKYYVDYASLLDLFDQ